MSSTRRASKRARIQRRAENDAIRAARRDSLAVLLSRAQRGRPLSTDEGALLRAAVEAEIREGDAARQSERGQQRAMEQQRQRVEAAEAAIVEAEDAADRQHNRAEQAIRRAAEEYDRRQAAEAALDRVRALAADMRTWCSPHGIATQYADDIERALDGEQQDHAVTAPPVPEPYRAPAGDPVATLARIRDARQWADVQAQLGMYYGWTAEQSGQRARAYRLAAEQRAEEAEQRLARIRDMVDGWERRLPATIRTATAADAVRYAADGDDQPVMFAVTDEQQSDAEERAEALLQRAERAEQDRAALATELQAVRARAQEAEEQSATQRNRATMWRAKAIETDDRADRYRAAWQSARGRAAVATRRAEHRLTKLGERRATIRELTQRAERAEQALADIRTPKPIRANHPLHALLDAMTGPSTSEDDARELIGQYYDAITGADRQPEVITDRATIRNTLDEPEQAEEPNPEPVTLATPCAYCGHNRNHHPCAGPCCVGNAEVKCGCPVFTVTAPSTQ